MPVFDVQLQSRSTSPPKYELYSSTAQNRSKIRSCTYSGKSPTPVHSCPKPRRAACRTSHRIFNAAHFRRSRMKKIGPIFCRQAKGKYGGASFRVKTTKLQENRDQCNINGFETWIISVFRSPAASPAPHILPATDAR